MVKRRPVIISPQAKQDIESILQYLKENLNQKVIDNFLLKLETFYTIRNRRKAVEVITVFNARQSPSKLKKALAKK